MALPDAYLMTTKKVNSFFNTIINAQPPAKFTTRFLEQLEFKTTSDRLYISVLRALKFIDTVGVPQERYFKFIDQTQSKQILAEAIKDAYSDLFAVNVKANELSATEVKNKLKTLFQGTKSEEVISLMANTFHALCNYADFSKSTTKEMATFKKEEPTFETPEHSSEHKTTHELINKKITTEMHYNIQIHLPETKEVAVYDAIFKSLKEHLL